MINMRGREKEREGIARERQIGCFKYTTITTTTIWPII